MLRLPTLRSIRSLSLWGAALAAVLGCAAAGAAERDVRSLDAQWRFHLGDLSGDDLGGAAPKAVPQPARADFDDHAWRIVDVPHDFVVEEPCDRKAHMDHGYRRFNTAWYRQRFTLPAAAQGKSVWIDFDGLYRDAKIWLNGELLGQHKSGYIGCRFDIAKAARYGTENVLAIHLDSRQCEGWWYEGGGIYRHVWLTIAAPVHVEPWGAFVRADIPDPGDGATADAKVRVTTTLANDSPREADATLTSEIVAADGRVVAKANSRQMVATAPGAKADFNLKFTLPAAQLWSLERPYLYKLRSTVSVDGQPVDQVTTTFGVRDIKFTADRGFFLNGKPVKLKGTSNHQDHAGVGVAVPDRLLAWRIERLKEMGSNAYRCAHNPVSPELLDACDRLGMLVMDENRHLGDTYACKASQRTPVGDLADLSALVRRDRNHPCVVLWSICNEEDIQGSPAGGKLAQAMKDRVNQLDGTRMITAAMNGGHGTPHGFSTVLDVEGFNYGPEEYAPYHKAHPERRMVGSETASTLCTRGIYANDPKRGYVCAYDKNAPAWGQSAENAWKPVAASPFVAGTFVWTGFDYKGEPTPYSWPCINSHFGIIDICGFPKDGFYYYQAWWSDRPVLHLLPHWNWPGKEGQDIDVCCYSNCPSVELFLNGKSLGTKPMPVNGHLDWKVKYQPGTLLAKGTSHGQELTTKVETTGAPAAVALAPDREQLAADGADLSVVTVKILDDHGRLVPTAEDEVSFTVSGPAKILGVGNGDPSSHESDKEPHRTAFAGLCLVLVQTTKTAGQITLTAQAPGLRPAAVKLHAK